MIRTTIAGVLLAATFSLAGITPPLRIAIMGNPVTQPAWNDENVQALVDEGFTAVQLNIAWGSRPNDEPLNLNDVVSIPGQYEDSMVTKRQPELRKRIDLAKKHGLKTLFHFGSPFMWRNPETGEVKRQASDAFHGNPVWFETGNPKLVEYETGLLREFVKKFGDVDDIMVYTYDQDAWQASQFQTNAASRGIPLHERLPKYLALLHDIWSTRDGTHRMWWEPWELSAGQVYKIIPQLPTDNFGLMIHNNIAEAQIDKPVDLWYRTVAHLAQQRGIPVCGEGYFTSMTEEVQALSIPCPRLVDEEMAVMTGVQGVVGVKEYFGVLPNVPDPNREMFSARLKNPDATTDQLLDLITERFGPQQAEMKKLLEDLSEAMRMVPFEASWHLRLISKASIDHGWSGATIHGGMADTPSWNSTRHAMFMKCDDTQPHPDMLEDVQLRCELAADYMKTGLDRLPALIEGMTNAPDREMLKKLQPELDQFYRVIHSYALHLRETNLAMMLRQDIDAKRDLTPSMVEEMKKLLAADVENQHKIGRVVEMRKAFDTDPVAFLKENLIPTDKSKYEQGYFTLTTR